MKRFLYIALIFVLFTPSVHTAYESTEGLLRLHIPANSNSAYDQGIKKLVKEYLLNTNKSSLCDIEKSKGSLEKDINLFLRKINAPYGCKITIENEYHKKYSSLPEGIYKTVRIHLGSGSGKNLFFVMYPDLAVKEGVTVKFTKGGGIAYKSKLIEIIKKVCKL